MKPTLRSIDQELLDMLLKALAEAHKEKGNDGKTEKDSQTIG